MYIGLRLTDFVDRSRYRCCYHVNFIWKFMFSYRNVRQLGVSYDNFRIIYFWLSDFLLLMSRAHNSKSWHQNICIMTIRTSRHKNTTTFLAIPLLDGTRNDVWTKYWFYGHPREATKHGTHGCFHNRRVVPATYKTIEKSLIFLLCKR